MGESGKKARKWGYFEDILLILRTTKNVVAEKENQEKKVASV